MEVLIFILTTGALVGVLLALGCFFYRKRQFGDCKQPELSPAREGEGAGPWTSGGAGPICSPGPAPWFTYPPGYRPGFELHPDWPASPPSYEEAVVAPTVTPRMTSINY